MVNTDIGFHGIVRATKERKPAVHDAAFSATWPNYGFGAHDEVMVTLHRGMAKSIESVAWS